MTPDTLTLINFCNAYMKKHRIFKPHLNCMIVSYALQQKLYKVFDLDLVVTHAEVDMRRYNGKLTKQMKNWLTINHAFLTMPDHKILDCTASQFNDSDNKPMPHIYYGSRPIWYR